MGTGDGSGKAIYLLTDKGERLYPVLEAIAAWALENINWLS